MFPTVLDRPPLIDKIITQNRFRSTVTLEYIQYMEERREDILFSEGPVTSSRWAGAALH